MSDREILLKLIEERSNGFTYSVAFSPELVILLYEELSKLKEYRKLFDCVKRSEQDLNWSGYELTMYYDNIEAGMKGKDI